VPNSVRPHAGHMVKQSINEGFLER
jgi:hypothetical protein